MADPITAALLSGGPMGIAAAAAWYLYLRERTEHSETRVRLENQTKTFNENVTALRVEFSTKEKGYLEQINDLRESHAVRELSSLTTIEYFAKSQVEAVEELARIADAVRRAYDSRSRYER